MWLNPQETEDLVTFTEEILMENLIFLSSETYRTMSWSWLPVDGCLTFINFQKDSCW